MKRDRDQRDLFALELEQARAIGHAAATMSAERAERASPGWRQHALELIRDYARQARAPFLTEDVRAYAKGAGLEEPPDRRAWGRVVLEARAAKIIRPIGHRGARSSHGGPKTLWRGL